MTDLRQALDEHGWLVVDGPDGAASTVGLTPRGLPELVVLGLPTDVGGALLHDLAERLLSGDLAGEGVGDGEPIDGLLDGRAPVLLTVDRDLPSPAAEVYGTARLRQLVWPDADGRMPWDDGFAHPDLQPLLADPRAGTVALDPDADPWPLAEDPHLQVLTSRKVAEQDAPVLVVVRTDTGELHFLDGVSEFSPSRAVVECLHQALERDRSLVAAVRELGDGMAAEREDAQAPWDVGVA
ncbi:MAG: DUF4262 domain-containing protein [Actinomycetes bacterium]